MKKHSKNESKLVWVSYIICWFYRNFFSNETTFYLNNPKGFLRLIDEENIIYSKNKDGKICACGTFSTKGRISPYL